MRGSAEQPVPPLTALPKARTDGIVGPRIGQRVKQLTVKLSSSNLAKLPAKVAGPKYDRAALKAGIERDATLALPRLCAEQPMQGRCG